MRDVVLILGAAAALGLSPFTETVWIAAALAVFIGIASAIYVTLGRWQATALATISCFIAGFCLLYSASGLPMFALVVLGLMTALAGLILFLSPIPHLPKPTGNHAVGTRRFEFDRGDRLLVYAWYPAEADRGSKPKAYHSKDEAKAIARGMKSLGIPAFIYEARRLARSHSIENAPVQSGQFPLVIFNHGGGLFPTQNLSLMEELASHGYVCFSIGHPGESAGLAWPNGEMSLIDPQLPERMKGSDNFQSALVAYMFEQDLETRASRLEALRQHSGTALEEMCDRWAQRSLAVANYVRSSDVPLQVQDIAPTVDKNLIIYAGMSLGGATATLCGYLDESAVACINLDGFNWMFDRLEDHLGAPILQCYADPNLAAAIAAQQTGQSVDPIALTRETAMMNDPYLDTARSNVRSVLFPGIGHMAFTDSSLSARPFLNRVTGLGGAAGNEFTRTLNSLVRSYVDSAVGRCDPSVFDELLVQFESKTKLIVQRKRL